MAEVRTAETFLEKFQPKQKLLKPKAEEFLLEFTKRKEAPSPKPIAELTWMEYVKWKKAKGEKPSYEEWERAREGEEREEIALLKEYFKEPTKLDAITAGFTAHLMEPFRKIGEWFYKKTGMIPPEVYEQLPFEQAVRKFEKFPWYVKLPVEIAGELPYVATAGTLSTAFTAGISRTLLRRGARGALFSIFYDLVRLKKIDPKQALLYMGIDPALSYGRDLLKSFVNALKELKAIGAPRSLEEMWGTAIFKPSSKVGQILRQVTTTKRPWEGVKPGTPEWMKIWRQYKDYPEIQKRMVEYAKLVRPQEPVKVIVPTSPKGKVETYIQLVKRRGGIKPTKDYEGLPSAALSKKGRSIDDMAKTLQSEGLLFVPSNRHPSDVLAEKLKEKAKVEISQNIPLPSREVPYELIKVKNLKPGQKVLMGGEWLQVKPAKGGKVLVTDGKKYLLSPGDEIAIEYQAPGKIGIKPEITPKGQFINVGPPSKIPLEKDYAIALKMKDGKVYYVTEGTHATVLMNAELDPEDVAEIGYIIKGKFTTKPTLGPEELTGKSLETVSNHVPKAEQIVEEEFPPVGLAIKKISQVPDQVVIKKPPPDWKGWSAWIQSWYRPVRQIARKFKHIYPVVDEIARLGRDVSSRLNAHVKEVAAQIDDIWKKIPKKRQKHIVALLDKIPSKEELAQLSKRELSAYQRTRTLLKEFKEIASMCKGVDVGKWTIPDEAYFPHIFVGSYQVKTAGKTVEGGFAKTLGEALDIAIDYLQKHPKADIVITPREFADEWTATLLTRKGFWRFISRAAAAAEISKDEIVGMMKGVAAIRPRPKFVGNFMQRVANLGGWIEDPRLALKIYTNRVLRKYYLDPYRSRATDLAMTLPPGLRKYFEELIADVGGKFDPFNNDFVMSRAAAKITRATSFLKLGYRPVAALVNRLQPFHTAYAEIGHYIFRGWLWKRTKAGQKVIMESGVRGQAAKYFAGEHYLPQADKFHKPLGLFSKAEMANREDVIAGGYLFARRVFKMSKKKAERRGLGYIWQYLEQFGDEHKAALEYAKDLNIDTNYLYEAADAPKFFRTIPGRIVGQFRLFTLNFLTQSAEWLALAVKEPNPHNIARAIRLIASNIVIGGLRSIPYASRIAILMALVYKAPVIGRGIFSLLGCDLSSRVGVGEFLPRDVIDVLGVGPSTAIKIIRALIERKWDEAILGQWSAAWDIYEAIKGDKDIRNAWRRGRKEISATPLQKIMDALGFTPLKLAEARDIARDTARKAQKYKDQRAVYIDNMIACLRSGNIPGFTVLVDEALKKNLWITDQDVIQELIRKDQSLMIRTFLRTPTGIRINWFSDEEMRRRLAKELAEIRSPR